MCIRSFFHLLHSSASCNFFCYQPVYLKASDKIRAFSPHKVFRSAQSNRFILVGVVQFVRQIVDILSAPCYPLLQIRRLYAHKALVLSSFDFSAAPHLHQTFLPPFTHDKILWPLRGDFLFFDRFAAGQPIRNSCYAP